MVLVFYHELESLRLAWMHWRAHASWGRELAVIDCVGSMLTLKASMAHWCATGTHTADDKPLQGQTSEWGVDTREHGR